MSINTRKLALACFATLTAVGLTFGAATAASADPTGSGPWTINGYGSDTTQDFMNAVADQSSGVMASWNATPSTGAPINPRPDGSGAGVQALSAAKQNITWNGQTVAGKIDFARSSSGPTAGTPDLTYIPFGRDAVSYVTDGSNSALQDIPLTTADITIPGDTLTLQRIFQANVPVGAAPLPSFIHHGVTYTVGNQASIANIKPFIPQVNSGTRNFWQGIVGPFGTAVSDSFTVTSPSPATIQVQEHNGRVTAEVPGAIVPFSIAQYIAQDNANAVGGQDEKPGSIAGITVIDRRWFAQIGAISGEPAISGTAINPFFPVTRLVYNVIDTADLGASANAQQVALNAAFSSSSSAVCTDTYMGTLKISLFGFGTISNCGDTTIKGRYLP